jgi:hypothetical protein
MMTSGLSDRNLLGGSDKINGISRSVREVRGMTEAMVTFVVVGIALSAWGAVIYASYYADRE